MQPKTVSSFLSVVSFGLTLWFAGHVYESIVLGPTILEDPIEKMLLWNRLFSRSGELLYYLPVLILVSGIIPLVLMALLLSVFMIRCVNFDLFHGDLSGRQKQFYAAAFRWNLLNGLRILFLGTALWFVFRAQKRSRNLPKGAH